MMSFWKGSVGPVVTILASRSEVHGLKSGWGRLIFSERKNLSMASFGREVMLWVSCHTFMHVKEPQAEIRAFEQNLLDFSRSA